MRQNQRNNLTKLTFEQKLLQYIEDCTAGVMAHCADGKAIPLDSIHYDKVEYISGAWRVQRCFPYYIQTVRNREFVLGDRLSAEELKQFEIKFFKYYRAALVTEGAYGYFKTDYDYIVANCGKYWSYGTGVTQARAFLAVKVLDEYTKNIYSAYSNIKNLFKAKEKPGR